MAVKGVHLTPKLTTAITVIAMLRMNAAWIIERSHFLWAGNGRNVKSIMAALKKKKEIVTIINAVYSLKGFSVWRSQYDDRERALWAYHLIVLAL